MRIEQARPDPEKAAKTQELHRRLRVCLSSLVWVIELKKTKARKKICHCFIGNVCSYAYTHTAHCMQHEKDITLLSGKSLEKSLPMTEYFPAHLIQCMAQTFLVVITESHPSWHICFVVEQKGLTRSNSFLL